MVQSHYTQNLTPQFQLKTRNHLVCRKRVHISCKKLGSCCIKIYPEVSRKCFSYTLCRFNSTLKWRKFMIGPFFRLALCNIARGKRNLRACLIFTIIWKVQSGNVTLIRRTFSGVLPIKAIWR